ncbi:hypothetical protein DSO57_1008024 [Entomophthora muscae]|uniref:Uncharacterized protein n=1 Tax=Entomophthora muscae TaxID=34485 RepID=A0ACC2UTC7_9FUNG|nr:hypothetical protein DSO57_1008024 [Entomophthora muscae]
MGNTKEFRSEESVHSSHASGNGVWATYFSVVCVTAGIGILTLPASLMKGGWVSVIFLIVAGFMAIFSSLLLIECKYAKSGEQLASFPEIGDAAFGKVGRYVIQTVHYLVLLGSGCILILVAGKVGKPLGDVFGVDINETYFILGSGVIVAVPLCILRRMKEFAWMALFGFLTTLLTLVVVVALSLVAIPIVPSPTYDAVHPEKLASVCSVFALSYAGNMIHPHVEGAMREPKKWPLALGMGLGTVIVFYLLMAVTGYAVFGQNVKEIMFDCFSGLHQTSFDVPNSIARAFIIAHILLATPLILCSFSTEVEPLIHITSEKIGVAKATIFRIIFRASVTLALTLTALYLPYTMELMQIIGSMFMVINLFLVPIICHLKLFGIKGRSPFQWICIVVTLVIGTITFFAGGYDNIKELITAIQAKK